MKQVIIRVILILTLCTISMLSACHKEVARAVPPPPPPAAPTASLTVSPEIIEKGQSTTLTWETVNATDVSIDVAGVTTEKLGLLQPKGSLQVTPSDSTTYTLYAKGPGGKEEVAARVTVTVPAATPVAPAGPSAEELFAQNMKDIYFDVDTAEIRFDQQSAIERDAAFLRRNPKMTLTVEGHGDERGSVEYNLALGDKRANAVKEMLAAGGVRSANITTISYGKEKAVCDQHDERCWQQNRRSHFTR